MLILIPVGIQHDVHHGTQNAAYGEHPPGGAPQIQGQPQPHIEGGCQRHQGGADGIDKSLALFGLRGGVVVPVVLADFVLLLLDTGVDKCGYRPGHDKQEDRHGVGLKGLFLGKSGEEEQQQGRIEENRPHAPGDEPDEFLAERLFFLLCVKVGDDRILFAEIFPLQGAGHNDHHTHRDNQQQDGKDQVLRNSLGVQQAAQAYPGDDASDGKGHAPGEAVHKPVVLRGILHQAVLHAAPHEGVQIHAV